MLSYYTMALVFVLRQYLRYIYKLCEFSTWLAKVQHFPLTMFLAFDIALIIAMFRVYVT